MTAEKAMGWKASGEWIEIREIEIYGPPPEATVRVTAASAVVTEAFDRMPLTVTVANNSGRELRGSVRIAVPEGWKAVPSELPVAVAGGNDGTFAADLVPPEVIEAGEIRAEATLADQAGGALGRASAGFTIYAPVSLTPQEITSLDPAEQALSVMVGTWKAVEGTLSLDVTELGVPGGKSFALRRKLSLPALGQQAVTFTVPGLDLAASAWGITYRLPVGRMVASVTQTYAIRAWMGLGPFPNEFGTDFGPEKGVDLTKTYPVPGMEPVAWKQILGDARGLVELTRQFQPNQNVCIYAAVYVRSPSQRKAVLSAGSDDGIKAWVNGKLAVSNDTYRGYAPGQEKAEVELRQGWNEVLLKITQGVGGWGFYFDLLGPDGKPMRDVYFSPTKK